MVYLYVCGRRCAWEGKAVEIFRATAPKERHRWHGRLALETNGSTSLRRTRLRVVTSLLPYAPRLAHRLVTKPSPPTPSVGECHPCHTCRWLSTLASPHPPGPRAYIDQMSRMPRKGIKRTRMGGRRWRQHSNRAMATSQTHSSYLSFWCLSTYNYVWALGVWEIVGSVRTICSWATMPPLPYDIIHTSFTFEQNGSLMTSSA